jgi:hypothetical protein
MNFDPLKLFFQNSEIRRDSNSQSGSPLKSMWVHSFTFSYTLENIKCDSQASLSTFTFASLCFGREPKARVTTYSSTHLFNYFLSLFNPYIIYAKSIFDNF